MKQDKARLFTYTQEITAIGNHESDVIAMEDAREISVQFNCPDIQATADFDVSLMLSNDGVYWHYDTSISATANSLFSANYPNDSMFKENYCRARFVKILIENYAEALSPTVVTAIVCIKD